jgi:hypothetical protein
MFSVTGRVALLEFILFVINLCFGNAVNTNIAYSFRILGLIITNTAVVVMTLNELMVCGSCAVSDYNVEWYFILMNEALLRIWNEALVTELRY